MTFTGRQSTSPYLPAHRISSAVIDLVESSTRHCYFVSPYVRLWPQLERALKKSVRRGVRLTFVMRHESKEVSVGHELSRTYGAEVALIDRLHAKLYLGDRTAIIGSMNLYDTSAARNVELAVLVQSPEEVQRIRREVLLGDVLALQPALRLPGSFEAAARREDERCAALALEIRERGHCVICAERMELDLRRSPDIVRCKPCWTRQPDVDRARFRIRSCHYCGKDHAVTLAKPLHASCLELVHEFLELREWRGPQASRGIGV